MKTITFSLKSVNSRSVIKCILSILFFLSLISCQEDDGLFTTINTEITSEYLLNGDLDLYISNNQIFRYKGKPGIQAIELGNNDLTDFEDCFVLYISKGNDPLNNISKAIIKLDGVEILNFDFSNGVGIYDFEICNITQQSILEVELRGEPGSYLDIWIEGKKKNIDTVADIEGNTYKIVKIGEQWWMTENLRSQHFLNGDVIPTSPIDPDIPSHCVESEPIYQWAVHGDESLVNTYGRVYTWYATMDARKICPTGWHIPTGEDWGQLIEFVGYSVGELKTTGTIEEGDGLWVSPNVCATNSTGLSIVPTGIKTDYWMWSSQYELAAYWLPSETPLPYAPAMPITNWNCTFNSATWPPCYGLSIRCIKD